MRLSVLLESLDYEIVGAQDSANLQIAKLALDSKEVSNDCLFFCLKGTNFDGHNFANTALKKGAVAVVVERVLDIDIPQIVVQDTRSALSIVSANFYANPSNRLKIIGITGTNGKTTTSYMLASIFRACGKKVGIIGTLGVRYDSDSGEIYLPSDLTTPDPIFLQETLAKMRLNGVEFVVMEVSAHALYYKKMDGVNFVACIFTNFTQDHLDFFETMTAYKKAKAQLFTPNRCPLAIINGDDETGREFGKTREKGKETTLYYGLHTPTDAFAIITDERLDGTECVFNINDAVARAFISLTGRHNLYNALASLTCAVALGVPIEQGVLGFGNLQRVDGRLERLGKANGADIFVDFAHTPDGLEKSLSALKKYAVGRLICLFGCGGNRDKTKRAVMGATVAKKCDFAVLTSDNPRFEDPLDIIAEIERGYRRFSTKYVVVPDRKKAIEYAIGALRAGDILLVAGKGGEKYQEIMGIKYPFCDNDIIEKIIQKEEPF